MTGVQRAGTVTSSKSLPFSLQKIRRGEVNELLLSLRPTFYHLLLIVKKLAAEQWTNYFYWYAPHIIASFQRSKNQLNNSSITSSITTPIATSMAKSNNSPIFSTSIAFTWPYAHNITFQKDSIISKILRILSPPFNVPKISWTTRL